MKKQVKASISAAVLAASLFIGISSCAQGDEITNLIAFPTAASKDAQEESLDFLSEALPFYNLSNSPSDVLCARFYNNNRYVPYVAMRYYLEYFDSYTFDKTSYSDGKYYYEYRFKGKSYPVTIDVNNDSIFCPEWAGFMNQVNSEEETALLSIIQKIINSYSGQKAQTFDLKKYGMKIYGGADDAYVPLCVLNLLFTARNYKEIFYNGEGVYLFSAETKFKYDSYNKSSWYTASDGSVCERPKELIDLSYNLLCFTHDYLYGHPGYYGFADDGNGFPDTEKVSAADALSFDAMLSTYDLEVRTMLKSSSYFDYIKGLTRLTVFTYGDSHSAPQHNNYLPDFSTEELDEIKNLYWYGRSKKILAKSSRYRELIEARGAATGRTNSEGDCVPFYVLSGGKTAVYTFDHFDVDTSAWLDYYKSSHVTANPDPADFESWGLTYPNDQMASFYAALYKLLNDSSYSDVKTVLIDVTCNGGGTDVCLYKLLSYLIEDFDFRKFDVHTGTRYNCYISTDLNLDGKIDGGDTEYRNALRNKFKFAVLTSRYSFSCGNAFPVICAEEGIPIIGERSSGGSCIVGFACTADGFPFQFSQNQRLSSKYDWSTIECGASVTSGGEITTASDFYNDTKLQEIIDKVVK